MTPGPVLTSSNCVWIWNQIELAETIEQLEQVAIDIGSDQFENEPYTKHDAAMTAIRQAYKSKLTEIKCQTAKPTPSTQSPKSEDGNHWL